MTAACILLLSANEARARDLQRRCVRLGYAAVSAGSDEDGVDALLRIRPQAVLVDICHPDADSALFLAMAAEINARVVVIGGRIEDGAALLTFGGGAAPAALPPGGDGLQALLERTLGA